MKFSINRVWLLLCKQWAENRQLYILGLLATAGIMAGVFLFAINTFGGLNYLDQKALMLMGLLGTGAIFTSTILSQFSQKTQGIVVLTLPASTFEKLVAALLYVFVIYPLLYLLAVYPVLSIAHYIDVEVAGHINSLYTLSFSIDGKMLLGSYLILQTVVLLFSLLFRRYVFVKTAVLVIVLFYGVRIVNQYIAEAVFKRGMPSSVNATITKVSYDNKGTTVVKALVKGKLKPRLKMAMPYNGVYIANDNDIFNLEGYYMVELREINAVLFGILFCLTIPFLWMITWFRLKETEL